MNQHLSNAADNPVRAGFIGVGNFVSANHLPNAHASAKWSVEAICDVDEINRTRAGERYQPRCLTDRYQDLLTDPEIEVIFIGTRHDLHERLIRESAEHGKDVFVEKPMSKTWAETRAILKSIQDANTRLMVGYNRRFAPAMQMAKQVYRQRNAGKPTIWTYRAVDDAKLWPSWPMDVDIGGGKVMSEGCHFYDLACWFLEDEPHWVQCSGRRDDDNLIQIGFANGSQAMIVSGGAGSATYPKERMEVFCDSSTLVLDMFLELHTAGYAGCEDEHFPMQDDRDTASRDGHTIAGFRRRARRWAKSEIQAEELKRKTYAAYPKVDKGHIHELDAYADAIRAGEDSPCGVIDGARATAIALRAIESLDDQSRPQAICQSDYQYRDTSACLSTTSGE